MEKIFVQYGDEKKQLKGEELEAFLLDREKLQKESNFREQEIQAQKELKISAYKKLGLTDEEIAAII